MRSALSKEIPEIPPVRGSQHERESSVIPSVVAGSPSERYALAIAAGPHREILDCQASCRLNVIATGKPHARSTSSGVDVTDDAIASGDTLGALYDQSPAEQNGGE
jgi:hypothetical protein